VLECFPGQFRNWFYSLLAMNAMMQADRWDAGQPLEPPFRTLLGHALVRDELGREMHKSLGNAIEFNTAAETIGAEIMRYIYAAQNPIYDLNFPDIAEDRGKDTVHLDQDVYRKLLTLWNCYNFYVTYAELDGITPGRLDVPLERRSELDRWILSKFQSLVRTAHTCMDDLAAHLLMEQFEKFLDALSNWYLRRSRRRFWKSESDTDKLAAYATLFEVLEGLCRLMAPILPFLTEEIYQNIVRAADADAPESVHLLDYPQVDESRVNQPLETRIDTLVRYKNLALRLRTQNSLKIRQPLGRLIVKPTTNAERAILGDEGIRAQLIEEINVKAVEFIETTDGLLQTEIRPNFKTLGQKYGPILKDIQAHLAAADTEVVLSAVEAGAYQTAIGQAEIALEADDLDIRREGPANLAFLVEAGAFVALDTTLTPELLQEGLARDFVRQVQQARKDKGLEVSDRIQLRYRAEGETAQAIETWADYIRRETLATELTADETLTDETATSVKVGKTKAWIAL
jgi:isoleucyl-tRNA synthetase